MKVLHIIESLGRGGAEALLVNLLPALSKIGVECHVAVLYPPYDLSKTLTNSNIKVHHLDLSNRWNAPQALFSISKLIRKEKFDIIHSHLFFSSFYSGLSKLFYFKAKRITTFHNLGYDSYPANTPWKKIRKKIDSIIHKYLIDEQIGASIDVQKHYASHLNLRFVGMIPNCVTVPEAPLNSNAERKKLLNKFNIKSDAFVILSPGRLVHEKGHRFSFSALRLLQEHGYHPHLLIYGNGPLKNQLTIEVEDAELKNQVHFHPAVDQAELYEAMSGADLILMSSTHEGWGLVAAETLGLALPLLATRVGAMPDIVENGVSGLLVEPKDPAAIANAIEWIITHPDASKRFGQAGREHVLNNFTPEIIARIWCDYYHSLLKKP